MKRKVLHEDFLYSCRVVTALDLARFERHFIFVIVRDFGLLMIGDFVFFL